MTQETTVRYPAMREELHSVLGLILVQEAGSWRPYNATGYGSIHEIYHWFFDDTQLGEAPEECIGIFLVNGEEAQLAGDIVRELEPLLIEVGRDSENAAFTGSPRWPKIRELAQKLQNEMRAVDTE